MASFLCICTECGQYVKGATPLIIGICQTHMCNVDAAQIKRNAKECKAILSTLIGDDKKEMFSSQEVAVAPAPPAPPPPPVLMASKPEIELKTKFDEVQKELKQKLVGLAEKVEMAQAAEEAARKVEIRSMVEGKNYGGRNVKRMLLKPTKSKNSHKRQRKN